MLLLVDSFLQVLDRRAVRSLALELPRETGTVLRGTMVGNLLVYVKARQGIRYMWDSAIDTEFLGDSILVTDLDI